MIANIFHQICLNILVHVINSLRAAIMAIQLQLTELNSWVEAGNYGCTVQLWIY